MRSWQVKIRALTHRRDTNKACDEAASPESERFDFEAVPALRIKTDRDSTEDVHDIERKVFWKLSPIRTRSSPVFKGDSRKTVAPKQTPTPEQSNLARAKRA